MRAGAGSTIAIMAIIEFHSPPLRCLVRRLKSQTFHAKNPGGAGGGRVGLPACPRVLISAVLLMWFQHEKPVLADCIFVSISWTGTGPRGTFLCLSTTDRIVSEAGRLHVAKRGSTLGGGEVGRSDTPLGCNPLVVSSAPAVKMDASSFH
jgi:hypothetical protein